MWNSIILHANYYYCDEIKEDERGGTSDMYGGDETCM